MERPRLLSSLAALSPLLPVARAAAQPAPVGPAWRPDRLVRFVVGFAPGGSTDTTARVVAQGITAGLGQPVVVENRTGAAGNVATEFVARSAPDGHTLVVASMGSHATNAALYRGLPFDVARDSAPISLVALSACLLVVRPSLPVRSFQELVSRAMAEPGRLNCGIAGAGSSQHFAAALFEHRAGVRFTQVSYRGGAPAMSDLVSGRLDPMFTPVVETIQQVRSGQARALGTTRPERSAELPDLAAIAEALPGYAFTSWLGLFAPAGAPAPAAARIAREVSAALRSGPTRERMERLGYEPVGGTPEEFSAFFAAELPRVAELVRLSDAKVN